MKIGVVVDGDSEFTALPALYESLRAATGHTFLNPIKAPLQPMAPYPVIARAARKSVEQLLQRGAQRVLILVDRETRHECPPLLAQSIQGEVTADADVLVVIKDRTFENWLIADLSALKSQNAKYTISGATERSVRNKADAVDALPLLKRCLRPGMTYHKVQDARRIMDRADIAEIARHSRSFRRFLASSGHPDMQNSSH
jgi:hypothetical protein